MSAFDLAESLRRAREKGRMARPRRDRGKTRFPADVERLLTELLHGTDRPRMTDVHRQLRARCVARGLPAPTRSSLYNALDRVPVPAVRWDALPPEVRETLFNVEPAHTGDHVPGDQVVFHAFNYGSPRALSYASGLPWLCLVRADRWRGWRPKSHALLRAVMRYRGL